MLGGFRPVISISSPKPAGNIPLREREHGIGYMVTLFDTTDEDHETR